MEPITLILGAIGLIAADAVSTKISDAKALKRQQEQEEEARQARLAQAQQSARVQLQSFAGKHGVAGGLSLTVEELMGGPIGEGRIAHICNVYSQNNPQINQMRRGLSQAEHDERRLAEAMRILDEILRRNEQRLLSTETRE